MGSEPRSGARPFLPPRYNPEDDTLSSGPDVRENHPVVLLLHIGPYTYRTVPKAQNRPQVATTYPHTLLRVPTENAAKK